MDSVPEGYELNGDLRPDPPGAPDARIPGLTGSSPPSKGDVDVPAGSLEASAEPTGSGCAQPTASATGNTPSICHQTSCLEQPTRWGRRGPINVNHYANKKSAAESMLDIALLMANASQLKAVIDQGPGFGFFAPLVALISISLVLQISVGVLLIFLGMTSTTRPSTPSWTSSTTWPPALSSSSWWSTSLLRPSASRGLWRTWRPSSRLDAWPTPHSHTDPRSCRAQPQGAGLEDTRQ